MEVASSGVSNGVAPGTPASFVDSSTVVQYLVDVLRVTLGALKTELEAPGSLLSETRYNETVQRCTRFASESQVALYVQKDIVGTEEANGADDGEGWFLESRFRRGDKRKLSNSSQRWLPSMFIIFLMKSRPLPPRSRPLPSLNDPSPSIRPSPCRRRSK